MLRNNWPKGATGLHYYFEHYGDSLVRGAVVSGIYLKSRGQFTRFTRGAGVVDVQLRVELGLGRRL